MEKQLGDSIFVVPINSNKVTSPDNRIIAIMDNYGQL
jgi:hypothetical protein